MTLILNNDDIQKALNIRECLDVMEQTYHELASSKAVNRPTCHTYLPHSLAQSSYSFKSVDGGVGKFGVLALRITSDIVQSALRNFPSPAKECFLVLCSCSAFKMANCWRSCQMASFSKPGSV